MQSCIMSYNEHLASKVRSALEHVANVKEKKMFGGLAFMVNDKMCITIGKDLIMCRIDPTDYNELFKREGIQKVIKRRLTTAINSEADVSSVFAKNG